MSKNSWTPEEESKLARYISTKVIQKAVEDQKNFAHTIYLKMYILLGICAHIAVKIIIQMMDTMS